MRWAAPAAWMLVIFLFSAQPAQESAALSGAVAQAVTAALEAGARLLGADAASPAALAALHTLIRKAAHAVVYAVLGALLLWALVPATARRQVPRGAVGLALLGSAAYALTDEFHQTFVPGRAGQGADVLLDTAGALAGILLLRWWWARRTRVR